MKRVFLWYLAFILLFSAGSVCVAAAAAGTTSTKATITTSAGEKVEPVVFETLAREGKADFIVWMADKADLRNAVNLSSREEKGRFVFQSLRGKAERAQRDLVSMLKVRNLRYKTFFIANKILVKGADQQTVIDIASRPDVARITANHVNRIPEPVESSVSSQVTGVGTNISFIKVPEVWALGYNGSGIVLAGHDTGLSWSHPAIKNQYRGCLNPPSCTSVNHNYNWWDATRTYPFEPDDGNGHGTHTTGTMVGDDGGANQIGVAPGAKTIHCKAFTDGGSGSDADILECLQWFLAPWNLNGADPDPARAPNAINNSWGHYGGNYTIFRDEIDALQAAGIAVATSSGNSGPSCQTLGSPGDYLDVMTTGSVGFAGIPYPGTISGFSSRGPSRLYPQGYFPDVMAPGENVRSSIPGGGYRDLSGTSMATPHTAALIGLMWSAKPSLIGQIEATYNIIRNTAMPLAGQAGSSCGGDYSTGPNNDWGFGTIDAYAAVLEAWGQYGLLDGYVFDKNTGLPVAGATITAGQGTGSTDSNGYYRVPLLPGTYSATATAGSYGIDSKSVTITKDLVTSQNFTLPAGRLTFTPTGVSEMVGKGETKTVPVTIANTGDLAVSVDIMKGPAPAATSPVAIPTASPVVSKSTVQPSSDKAPKIPKLWTAIRKSLYPQAAGLTGVDAYALDIYPGENLVTFNTDTPDTWTVIGSTAGRTFYACDFRGNDYSKLYSLERYENNLYTIDRITAAATLIGPSVPVEGEKWTGLTSSVDGVLYASSANVPDGSTLYTINPMTGAATIIGQITNTPCIIDIAMNPSGDLYGVDICSDVLVQINPRTAEGTIIGSIGFDANYAQGMSFNKASGILYLAAFNTSSWAGELRVADPTTGNTTFLGTFPDDAEVDCLSFPYGPDVSWYSFMPSSATLNPGESIPVTVTLDATGPSIGEGTYHGGLRVWNTSPYGSILYPVTMDVVNGFTISGTILFNGSPLSGVTMNGLPGSPVTNGSGTYSSVVNPGWTGTVTPARTGYTFSPANRSYTNVMSNIGNQDFTALQCTYTISPVSKTFPAKGFGLSTNVTVTGSGMTVCPAPSVRSGSPWITAVLGTWSKNKATVKVTVTPSTQSSVRTGTVTIGDTVFTATQAGAPCSVTALSPTTKTFPKTGGDQTFTVTTSTTDCSWSASTTQSSWIHITSGSGTGNGSVTFFVDTYTGTMTRSGSVVVQPVSGGSFSSKKTFTVKQTK